MPGRHLLYRLTTKAIFVLGYSSLDEVRQLLATLREGSASGQPAEARPRER